MTDDSALYPPSPPAVPPDLTAPTPGYRLRVVVVLLSLFVFAVLYLGLVIGSAYLSYFSFTSLSATDPHQASRDLLQAASQEDQQLTQIFNNALQRSQRREIDTAGFLRILEVDVLPRWRELVRRLTDTRGLSTDEQRLVEQYAHALKVQQEGWELIASAIRQNSEPLAKQSQEKMREADGLAQRFGADASRYYSSHARQPKDDAFWPIVTGIASGLLCLFLVKGFFKWRRRDATQWLEITDKDEPDLFAFIRRVCQDTRAPRPHRVYLSADVNAAVFYHESVLSLIVPTPKNLVIGLGLVNRLNLSEFKAVLAHEFGHFSQNSMKLGTYVYTSNRVIADIVFARDWLDDLVTALRGIDIRIAVFAWAFTGTLWSLRKTLQGLFRVINFANSALSRQMEFNADLVAVSVTGSDAIVHSLARLTPAADALGQAWTDLMAAADRQLYSRDLFYHQTRAVDFLRALRKDPRFGELPLPPDDRPENVHVFQPEDTAVPRMWATHPSNHDREVNAKRRYIPNPIDERSPWLLFRDAPAVRENITRRLYQSARQIGDAKLESPEVVQAFIDAEHAETTYHARYHGLYNNRYLTPGDLAELLAAASAEVTSPDRLAEAHRRLYDDELSARMEAHRAHLQDFGRVATLAQGATTMAGKDFQFRGARHRAADAKQLVDQVKKELNDDYEWMARSDREAFLVHHAIARQLGVDAVRELEDRYRFHMAVQVLHAELVADRQQVETSLRAIGGKQRLSQGEFQVTLSVFAQAREALAQVLERSATLSLPPLTNITPGEPLRAILLNQPLVPELKASTKSLDGAWVGKFQEQLSDVIDRIQRIHFKSLGGILSLQEKLAEQWAARANDCGVNVAP
jgi:Zn-dependent protease with chaperone function